MTLQEIFDCASTQAATIFKEEGELCPMWHAIAGNGDHLIIGTPWDDDDAKEATLAALRRLFQHKQVKRYAFICEGWSCPATEEELMDEEPPRPSLHPERREILAVIAEDRDGSMLQGFYYILRPEHGPAKLSPVHMSDGYIIAGRMTGLLT